MNRKRKTLLLVEDEALIAMAQKMELEHYGYSVLTAYSGEDAISVFRESDVDLVLMDIDLGKGIDGTETAEIILEKNEIPIVFLSSHSEKEIVEKTEKITSYGYVVKNTGITVLDASIKMAFKLFDASRSVKVREREYKTTIDNLLVGVVLHASDTSILHSNKEASAILGLTAEQMAGKEAFDPIWSFVYKDLTPVKIEDYPVNRVKSTEKAISDYDIGIVRPDRDYITWVNVNAAPTFTNDGELDKIIINFVDVTERLEAEEKLKDSETRYRNFITHSSEGIYRIEMTESVPIDLPKNDMISLINNCAVIEEVNNALAKMYGLKPEEMIGKKAVEFAPNYGERAILVLENEFYQIENVETLDVNKDGEPVYLNENYHGEIIDNKLVRIWGVQRNITEHKVIETQVYREKEFTDTALDAQLDTFFLFELNTGKAVRWNRSFKEISGYSDDEIAAMEAPGSYYGPQDLERAGAFIQRVLEDGSGTIDLELVCKNGSKVPTEYRVSVINDEKGNPKYIISIGRDITERILNEKMIQDEKMLSEEYINSLPGLFYIFDEERFVKWNKQWEIISGYSADELGKMYGTDFFKGSDKELIAGKMHDVFKNGSSAAEAYFVTKQGDEIPYYFTGLRKEFDGKLHLIGLGVNISDRKKAEDALKKALNDNKELLSELQHRAKNSFAMISGMIGLAEDASLSDESKNLLVEIGSRVRAVSEMYSLLYTTDSVFEVRLDDYLDRIISALPGIPPDITISNICDAVVASVKTAITVGIIITELLTNAIKHAFPKNRIGTIAIKLKKSDAGAVIEVRDDGVGFPEGVEPSAAESMGMMLVHNLVKQIRGSIKIDTQTGTCCTIVFPIENTIKKD